MGQKTISELTNFFESLGFTSAPLEPIFARRELQAHARKTFDTTGTYVVVSKKQLDTLEKLVKVVEARRTSADYQHALQIARCGLYGLQEGSNGELFVSSKCGRDRLEKLERSMRSVLRYNGSAVLNPTTLSGREATQTAPAEVATQVELAV